MQYQIEFNTDCSSRLYHMAVLALKSAARLTESRDRKDTHMSIIAGWIQLSKNPNRNRTAINDPKRVDAAEHATIAPQINTLTDSILATGNFCNSRFWGYSPTRMPIYRIVPSREY